MTWLAWLATVLAVAVNVPQTWRTVVHGKTAGLPASRFWILLVNAVVWIGYGIYGGGAVQIVNNAATAVLGLATLVCVLLVVPRSEWRLRVWLGVTVVTAGLTVLLGQVGGMAAVGVLASTTAIVVAVPQLVHLLRFRAASVDGVSALSVWFGLLAKGFWVAYGLVRNEPAVIVASLPVALLLAWTMVLLARRRKAESRPAQVVAPVATAF